MGVSVRPGNERRTGGRGLPTYPPREAADCRGHSGAGATGLRTPRHRRRALIPPRISRRPRAGRACAARRSLSGMSVAHRVTAVVCWCWVLRGGCAAPPASFGCYRGRGRATLPGCRSGAWRHAQRDDGRDDRRSAQPGVAVACAVCPSTSAAGRYLPLPRGRAATPTRPGASCSTSFPASARGLW